MTQDAVDAVRLAVDEAKQILPTLSAAEWAAPSRCPGWRVQDLVAHMSSNFKETVDPSPPPPEPPALPAEAMMELLVDPRRAWAPEQVRDEYLRYCDDAVNVLASLQAEPVASNVVPLADLGSYPMHLLADAYAFDHYCHQRVDLLAPEGPIVRPVEPAGDIRLRPAVRWMLAGLPQMQPGLEQYLPAAGALRLTLTGAGAGSWLVRRDGDTIVVEADDAGGRGDADGGQAGDADGGGNEQDEIAEIVSGAHAFVLWGTTRAPWRAHCAVRGDDAAATRFLDALNII